ncbi:hypothetical protein S40288_02815 [Stachybotrys chartarum IBT 40288]|nr:hypothetical protein S40288_02815 [Stachybotrys chartarum IBT 40288]
MAAEIDSPAREPAARGRGRGGRGSRGGRGRGGGRGAPNAAVTKAAAAKPGRGGTRRGRAKNFSDSRVQAAYERQRELKANYQAVAHALKPALQELAERNIEEALQNPDLYKHCVEHLPVTAELQRNFDKRMAEFDRHLECSLKLAENTYRNATYVTEQEYQNGLDEIEELFLESQESRLRSLEMLHRRGLPVDILDDQYEYKVITDEHYDKEFGIYQSYKDGHLVPYPSRVEGTEMWQRVRDADAAVAASAAAAPAKVKGRGRGINKRRAQDQPDGHPTPKKSTRGTADDSQLLLQSHMAPTPAKGLLASAAEVEVEPEGTPADEDSVPASPEPLGLPNGLSSAAQVKAQGKVSAREKSPPLPKNAAEPDEHGFRLYNQRLSTREKWTNSRFLAPRLFLFEDWEIGFRDSSNDSSKGHTRAKRGKYLDSPNSNGMHFDHWCNGYDFSVTVAEDFDQDVVERYGIHPTFGTFMATSTNEQEAPHPYIMPGKPIVYIANPSGRISHASRSFQPTVNSRSTTDAPWRTKVGSSLRRFCKIQDIGSEEIDVSVYTVTDEELRSTSLGTAIKELEARPRVEEIHSDEEEEPQATEKAPEPQQQGGMPALSALAYATAFVEAQNTSRTAPPTPKPPARYDAIRDVFTESKPTAPPPAQEGDHLGMNLLAEICNVENRLPGTIPQQESMFDVVHPADHAAGGSIHMENEPHRFAPVRTAAIVDSLGYTEPISGFQSFRRGQDMPHPQDRVMYDAPSEQMQYHPPVQEQAAPQPSMMRGSGYDVHVPPPLAPSAPHMQEPVMYHQHSSYPMHDPRDHQLATGHHMDQGYDSRRMSGYAADPGFSRSFWPQQPPVHPHQSHASLPPAAPAQQHQPAPSTHSRIPFSHGASAEPLPPLRPPRTRNQSLSDDTIHDPNMRSGLHGNLGSYYPPGPTRPYSRMYPGPEASMPLLSSSSERILPNPQPSVPGYMTSPHQGYAPQLLSPTFGNPASLPNPMNQSPPGTPHGGPPSSIHRHRSTPSGSSDAGSNKYRKLQPAPVPAHRAWSNKPELKTIPYDHKETGGAAALPSSGPTQIRGWNAKQPAKSPITLPPLYEREQPAQSFRPMVVESGTTTHEVSQPAADPPDAQQEAEQTSIKQRLRPRKAKPAESQIAPGVKPSSNSNANASKKSSQSPAPETPPPERVRCSHEALTPADQVQDSVTVASTANTTITDPQGDKEAVGKTAD